jgi:3-phenylpropionate/trans-cinnamate dioxygenase ferredoxin reductase subunit
MAQGYFILGNGGAANYAIEAIRTAGYTGALHQISDDTGDGFNPMVAPYFLKGTTAWENCFPFKKDFFEKHQVTLHHGDKVVALDAEKKSITTNSGKVFSYDKCLIATGASPAIPPVPGLRESNFAFPLREPNTADVLAKRQKKAKKVVVLGASFVGVKLAEVFLKHGIEVILADIAPQIMPQGAHCAAARHVEKYLEYQGITIKLGASLSKVEDTENSVICHFPDGSVEEVDFIAVSAGIRPNLDFLDPLQVTIDRAICTNLKMQTNWSDLYAAGDVCETLNRLSASQQWMGTWGNATYQGKIAGLNMAGQQIKFAGSFPHHVSPIFSWTYMQVGDALRKGDNVRYEEHGNPFDGPYYLTVYQNDTLVGANLINNPDDLLWIKKEINRVISETTVA